MINCLVYLHPACGIRNSCLIFLRAIVNFFLYFLAAAEYLFFLFVGFISFITPCRISIVIFSSMFIYSLADLSFIQPSLSIFAYATCILYLNSSFAQSFCFSLFHIPYNSFLTSFCSWSNLTYTSIGTWSLKNLYCLKFYEKLFLHLWWWVFSLSGWKWVDFCFSLRM